MGGLNAETAGNLLSGGQDIYNMVEDNKTCVLIISRIISACCMNNSSTAKRKPIFLNKIWRPAGHVLRQWE